MSATAGTDTFGTLTENAVPMLAMADVFCTPSDLDAIIGLPTTDTFRTLSDGIGAAVVVVVHEAGDSLLQITRRLVWDQLTGRDSRPGQCHHCLPVQRRNSRLGPDRDRQYGLALGRHPDQLLPGSHRHTIHKYRQHRATHESPVRRVEPGGDHAGVEFDHHGGRRSLDQRIFHRLRTGGLQPGCESVDQHDHLLLDPGRYHRHLNAGPLEGLLGVHGER